MKATPFAGASAESDGEFNVARSLMAADRDLDRRIVGALAEGPRRFGDLKSLLAKRTEANLTQALARLTRDGLIVQRAADWQDPTLKTHELTPLGTRVLYHIVEMDFVLTKKNLKISESAVQREVQAHRESRRVPKAKLLAEAMLAYKQGKASLSQAARMANIEHEEMQRFLVREGIFRADASTKTMQAESDFLARQARRETAGKKLP